MTFINCGITEGMFAGAARWDGVERDRKERWGHVLNECFFPRKETGLGTSLSYYWFIF